MAATLFDLDTLEAPKAIIEVPLANGGVTTIDKSDFDAVVSVEIRGHGRFEARICDRSWYWHKTHSGAVYVHTAVGRANVKLHRLILGAPLGSIVDHKNGNGLDNYRDNLRYATTAQNAHNSGVRRDNSTGFKGVSFIVKSGKYDARIRVSNKQICLGSAFLTAKEAALAYDAAAREHFGEFAWLNFPELRSALAALDAPKAPKSKAAKDERARAAAAEEDRP